MQQAFHLRNDNLLAEPVNRGSILLLDSRDDVEDGRLLASGKKQGLLERLIPETVLVDGFGQRRIPDKIRVNVDHPS